MLAKRLPLLHKNWTCSPLSRSAPWRVSPVLRANTAYDLKDAFWVNCTWTGKPGNDSWNWPSLSGEPGGIANAAVLGHTGDIL